MEPHCLGLKAHPGRTGSDPRLFLEAVFWIVRTGALLPDKAFDGNWIIEELNARGATICISQWPQRRDPLEIDQEMYTWRHLVENVFCDLKDFKRIAQRGDKTDTVFAAMIYAASAFINGR